MSRSALWSLLATTVNEWLEDKAPRLAAALAYYTVFALAQVLLIAIWVAGFVLEGVESRVVEQIRGVVGPQAASAVQTMLEHRGDTAGDALATVVWIGTLLLAATGFFGQLQDALNTIWEVRPKPSQGFLGTVKARFFSFTMVLGVGFLLLVSFVLSAVLAALVEFFDGRAGTAAVAWKSIEVAVSLAATSGLFALIFKVVPDAKVAWRDVWVGAVATAVLFMLGKELISRYLATESTASAYGAAGALVLLLIWVYYSAQILFLGAELTQVYARTHGSGIRPASNAEPVGEAAREEQGIEHDRRG